MGTQPSPDSAAYTGFQDPTSGGSETNALQFLVSQMLGRLWTSTLVQVVAVTNTGALEPVGFVDVQPLVNQIDGAGNATAHGVIHNVPYMRIQGGVNAVIIDPAVNDIGLAVFASRDISAVKATKKANIPGSFRRFNPADGLYFGGFLNAAPQQYVRFSADGVEIVSPTKVTVTAPNVEVNASTRAKVTSPHVDLISDDVNLGGAGGKKVVLDGDPVIGGGGGTVHASSTKVKAV